MTDTRSDDELRRIINDPHTCFDHVHRQLAAELLELRTAQHPPLGYIVLSRNPDSGRLQPQGRVHAETGLAQDWQRHLESAPGPRITIRPGTQFLVAEVREVQP